MALDDGERRRQPEPCPLADFLHRKKGLKNTVAHFRRDTRACVGDSHEDVGAGLGIQRHRRIGLIEDDVVQRHADRASVRHRIPGIDTEVHQHLMNLRRVARERPQTLGRCHPRADRFGKGLAHDLDDVSDERHRVHCDALAVDASRERQHLLHEVGAPFGAFMHRRQQLARLVGRDLVFQQLGGHQDRGQDVIEVVRNPAGEGADAFHPLRAQELLFELLAVGDVLTRAERAAGLAGVVSKHAPIFLDGFDLAVRQHDPMLDGPEPLAFDHVPERRVDAGPIGGVHSGEKALVRDWTGGRSAAKDPMGLVGPHDHHGVEVGLPATDLRHGLRRHQACSFLGELRGELTMFLLALFEHLRLHLSAVLRKPPLRDVEMHHDHAAL